MIDRRAGALVLVDAVAWATWSATVGYAAHRMPQRWFARDRGLWRLRAWEVGGRVYARASVRRWKDRLPDAGGLFTGGVSKRQIATRRPEALTRLAVETRRAELVHWLIPAFTPAFAVWNPAWLVAAMAAYAVVANVPCIVVQRYNRARVFRVLERLETVSR